MVARRSEAMDALRRNAFTVWPGMTIGWIGDPAHQGTVSGHNPDDTPGVRAELADADDDQEVRALDFMLGPAFSRDQADMLVDALVNRELSRRRLYYVIWQGRVWHRDNGWVSRPYTGSNPHTTHVHASGWAGTDSDGSNWTAVLALGGSMSFETDLNAWYEKYEGGPGETTATIRTVRENARITITGSPNLAARVDELGADLDALATEMVAQFNAIKALIEAIPAGQLGDHTHVINGPTSGPVVDT